MRTITDTTFSFLKNQYERWVQEFLDDPDGMCTPDLTKIRPGDPGWEQAVANEIVLHYRELSVIGPDCDTTFWAVALKEATTHEINRLVEALRLGGVTDIPQEVISATQAEQLRPADA